MWSFFSRDPTKDFNYDVGEKVPGLEDRSLWTLRQGKKKDTGDPVSIFTFDIESGKEAQTQLARTAFKRIKTLRHPNILTFLDGLETDRIIYFVTELVSPLSTYHGDNESDRNRNELSISWGLHQICKGLSFLVNDCGFVHNNVCMASVFVDQAGEWKLGGIEYLYQAKDTSAIPPLKFLPALEIYNPPEKEDYAKRSTKEKWAGDMWGLGCLIWEVFNGNLRKSSSLKAPGKISQSLLPHYCQLVGANPKSRPNPAKFLENCRQRNGFMDNTFVNTMLYLEEIQIKDQNEKNEFFNSLTPALDSFPVQFCRHKILPQLVHAFEYGNAGSSVLAPLFKVGKLLDTEEYQKKIVPCVIKLFSSPDRATRVKLLQQIDIFVEHLQTATVNEQIFPHVTQGLMDTNPLVRESTIKAMLHLAPKLNYKNLNEELMKHFARLQTKDEQGGIRTNTTVCLGKIANYLCPQIRQKIISSAFLRALKDPFPPARQAGILAMAATQNYYFVKDIGMRLLPALSAMTVDPDKCVRDQTFKAIKGFLSKLETVSENPDLLSEIENEAKTGRSNSSSSWAGWAVTGMSSLTSRLYSKTSQNTENETGQSVKQQAPHQSPSQQRISFMKSDQLLKATETKLESEDGWEDADDWGEIEDVRDGSAIGISDSQKTTFSSTDGWDDENWGSLEASKTDSKDLDTGSWEQDEFTSTQDCGLQTTSNYNWNTGSSCKTENNFSSFIEDSLANINSKSPGSGAIEKPHAASRTLASPSPWEGTFEWEGDNWSHPDESGISNVKTTRRPTKEREERRLQREKELQEKRDARKRGIMKLGTKKIIK